MHPLARLTSSNTAARALPSSTYPAPMRNLPPTQVFPALRTLCASLQLLAPSLRLRAHCCDVISRVLLPWLTSIRFFRSAYRQPQRGYPPHPLVPVPTGLAYGAHVPHLLLGNTQQLYGMVPRTLLPVPLTSSSAGEMLKGLPSSMRDDSGVTAPSPVDSPSGTNEAVYGDTTSPSPKPQWRSGFQRLFVDGLQRTEREPHHAH
ncbi:hypothetical protein BDR03DRAFT_1017265 [Suillus americanus]|nr:hypothetical protein BDR03DRAFT_1017265 [Suillus americanus]